MEWPTKSSRKFLRLNVPLHLEWMTQRPGEAKDVSPQTTLTRDISGGGLSFLTDQPIETGTYLTVTIHGDWDPEHKVQVQGVIMWSRRTSEDGQWLAGLKFLSPPEAGLHSLLLDAYKRQDEHRCVCANVRSCGDLRHGCPAWENDRNCFEIPDDQMDKVPTCHWKGPQRDCKNCPVSVLCFLT